MGLVARSFWVSREDALTAEADSGIPLIGARVLGAETIGAETIGTETSGTETTVVLAPALAAEPHLDALRVLWLRTPGDTSDVTTQMNRAQASILRLIPQRNFTPTFAEVIVPDTLSNLSIPKPPPDWQQFVVEPSDRPHPAGLDSFFDLDTAPQQGLHAALLIGGILGGHQLDLERLRDARTDTPWVVHPFSRVVRGGDRARREAEVFLRERFPSISAADVAPTRFTAPDPADAPALLDDAADWVRDLDNGALRFHRPAIVLDPPRRLSFFGYLADVARFVPWAARGMFGVRRWSDLLTVARARFARRLESQDLGATIDLSTATPEGLHLTDWDALEEQHRATDAPRIARAARHDGDVPDAIVWQGLSTLASSLIDGSTPPHGWEPPGRFELRYALPPQEVLRSEAVRDDVTVPEVLAELPGASDELSRVRRIGQAELDAAVATTVTAVRGEGVHIEAPSHRVAHTARAVAETAREAESEYRDELVARLGSAPAVADLPLLSRVRRGVVADLLLARATAERLTSISGTSVQGDLPALQRAVRLATWWVLGALILGGVAIGLLAHFGDDIDDLLAQSPLEYPTSWTQLAVGVGVIALSIIVATLLRLHRMHRAHEEIGRRRLEYGDKRTAAAIHTFEERNRLRNAERILSAWEDVLSHVHARDLPEPPGISEVPGTLPDALQVADPDMDDDEMRRLTERESIDPGWFRAGLDALLEASVGRGRLPELWDDEGLPGGVLAELRADALGGDAMRAWWREWASVRTDRVVLRLATDDRQVRHLWDGRPRTLALGAFVDEILRSLHAEYEPGRDYEEEFDPAERAWRIPVHGRVGTGEYRLNSAMTTVATVLIIRRFGRATRPQRRAGRQGPTDAGLV